MIPGAWFPLPRVAAVLLACPVLLTASPAREIPEPDLAPLRTMLRFQKNLRTLSADYIQSRSIRTLRHPLVSRGSFFFEAPGSFRWENGNPPGSILIGNSNRIFLIRRDVNGTSGKQLLSGTPGDGGSWFSLFSQGDFDTFRRSFRVLSLTVTGTRCRAVMQPLDAQAARGVAEIRLDFNKETGAWTRLEIVTRDGSSIAYEFNNIRINPTLPAGLFDPDHPTSSGREAL